MRDKHDGERVNIKPTLRVSESKKRANDFAHTKHVIDYFIENSCFYDETTGRSGQDLQALYDAYNGHLPASHFHYVTNPFNSSQAEYTNWPARLRSYPIIRPNIDLLEGEYDQRPFSYFVKVNNPDAVNTAQEKHYQKILGTVEQMFINKLNEAGIDTGQPSKETQEIDDLLQSLQDMGERDFRAIQGEAALNVLMDDLFVEEVFKTMFHDWVIAGEIYSYKNVRRDEIEYERVSPLDIDYDKAPDVPYVEDGQWAVRRMFMTASDLIDLAYDELDEEDHLDIETAEGHLSFKTSSYNGSYHYQARKEEDLRRDKIEVFHVAFKYKKKIGILTYFSEDTMNWEEIVVPEGYKPDKEAGEKVEWMWVNEVWEGFKAQDFYFGIRPIPVQRNEMSNFSVCKLPYNGKRYSDTHSENTSIVRLGLPFEILHRILHFNLEKTIAKSKGKIAVLDIHALPTKDGWDEERAFYWADAQGYMLTDRSAIGVDKGFQYQVLDLGLYEHIANMIQLMEYVKQEWDDVVGITRQRKGKTQASETATGVEAATYQSSVVSERLFSKFEEFAQRELMGLLDCSKLAWIDGLRRVHVGDDMKSILLDIDPVEYSNTQFGLFVTKSARDRRDLEMAKGFAQAFAQNGVAPSIVIDTIRATSMAKLSQLIRQAETKTMKAQQAAAASEAESEERSAAIKAEYDLLLKEADRLAMHEEYDRKEDIAAITKTGVDPHPDQLSADKMVDAGLKAKEISLKERAQMSDERLREKEIASKEKIEKLKAKTALKNKVSGEK